MIKVDKRKLYICSTYNIKSKRVIVNACYSDEIESKIVHISVNTSEVKDAMNKTKYEEPSVTDKSVINVLSYFKLFGCNIKFLIILMPRMNECAWQLHRKSGIPKFLVMDERSCYRRKKISIRN